MRPSSRSRIFFRCRADFSRLIRWGYATYTYTPNGKQQDVIDANGNHARLTYDGFDRQSQWQFPSTTGPSAFNPADPSTAVATAGAVNTSDYEEYGYDANGNRTSFRKRDGNTIGYAYDPLNRVTTKDIPGGSGSDVYYAYDLLGHQLYSRFGSTSGQGITNAYDGFGRLTVSVNDLSGGYGRGLWYYYDADSNRTCLVHPDGNYFVTDYDGLDRATTTYETGVGGTCSKTGAAALFTATYNAQGLRSGLTRNANGTSTGYGYADRLTSLTQDFASTGSNQTWSLGYNPASQIKTLTSANDAYAWTGGVNANRNYTPNGLNQYSNVAGTGYSYDANGNLTNDGSTGYGYDVENRLVSASGARSANLTYDPNGRLGQARGRRLK